MATFESYFKTYFSKIIDKYLLYEYDGLIINFKEKLCETLYLDATK